MKRLVLFAYDYPPNNGGIARLCSEIINQCKLLHQPYLVITPVEGPDEEHVVRLVGKRPWNDIRIFFYLRKQLTSNDVVLTATFHPDGLLAVLTGHKNIFFLGHGTEFLPGGSFFRRKIWPFYRRWILTKCKANIANSSYTANLIRNCSPSSQVVPLPLAVDHIRFHPTVRKTTDGLLRLCSVSRLEQFKAQDFVIKVIAGLPDEVRAKIRFEIAGKGPYKATLEKLVQETNLSEVVKFLGYVSDEELRDFYSRNDVFILTTREINHTQEVEGFGLVFTEAQACATACIGSRTGGIPDAIEEGNGGWLIEQDNEDELRSLLIELINNHQQVLDECAKARNRIETTCNWTIYTQKLFRQLSLS